MFTYCSKAFDALFSEEHVLAIEDVIIMMAVLGFTTHIAVITYAKMGFGSDRLLELAGPDFFTALYTPFSFILVYEVFALILALSHSFSSSIGVQYQIIALIFVRRIFGDIGHLGKVQNWNLQNEWVRWLLMDMVGALGLFLLVTVYFHLKQDSENNDPSEAVSKFIDIKKSITLFIAIFAIIVGIYNFGHSLQKVIRHVFIGDVLEIAIDFVFYKDLFTLLVFADVFVLLAAYRYSDEFSLIFRNIGFVISTITLRLSMSVPRPLDIGVAIGSIGFGISILAIYRYYQFIQKDNK